MTTPAKLPAAAQKTIERIASERCGFETLEERHSDRLDFKEVSVWGLKAALEAAFLAGRADAKARGKAFP